MTLQTPAPRSPFQFRDLLHGAEPPPRCCHGAFTNSQAASKGHFFAGRPPLGAVESSFFMLAVIAAIAAILSLLQEPAPLERLRSR